jgi:hypothetical protein
VADEKTPKPNRLVQAAQRNLDSAESAVTKAQARFDKATNAAQKAASEQADAQQTLAAAIAQRDYAAANPALQPGSPVAAQADAQAAPQ